MKKSNFLLSAALLVVVAACSDETTLVSDNEQSSEKIYVQLTAGLAAPPTDGNAKSRTLYEPQPDGDGGYGMKVTWNAPSTEHIRIIDTSRGLSYTLDGVNGSRSGDGKQIAFAGELPNVLTWCDVWYPAETHVESGYYFSFLGQKQTGNGSTAHIASYDLMHQSVQLSGGVSTPFSLERVAAMVRLQLQLPTTETFTRIILRATDNEVFFQTGKSLISEGDGYRDWITLDLADITPAENDNLVAYLVVKKWADAAATCYISAITDEDVEYRSNNFSIASGQLADNTCTTISVASSAFHRGNVYIPDANFKQYLLDKKFDTDGDGEISKEEAENVQEIVCEYEALYDMTGINAFTNITKLWSTNNGYLTELTLRNFPYLKELNCSWNQLEMLTLGHLPALEVLYANNNRLTTLDVSAFPHLNELIVGSNPELYTNAGFTMWLKDQAQWETLVNKGISYDEGITFRFKE
jgi:hypothetical protein